MNTILILIIIFFGVIFIGAAINAAIKTDKEGDTKGGLIFTIIVITLFIFGIVSC